MVLALVVGIVTQAGQDSLQDACFAFDARSTRSPISRRTVENSDECSVDKSLDVG